MPGATVVELVVGVAVEGVGIALEMPLPLGTPAVSALVDVGVGAGCFFGGTFGNGSSPVFSHAGLGFAIVHAVEIGVVRSAVSMLGANGEPAYGGGTEGFHAGAPSCLAHLS